MGGYIELEIYLLINYMGITSSSEQNHEQKTIKKLELTIAQKDQQLLDLEQTIKTLKCTTLNWKDSKKVDISALIKAKKDRDYEYIVFSGGGIKGISYCGILKILEEQGILKKLKGYAGTSAGSIITSLLAVGYTANELKEIMMKLNFGDFLDDKWLVEDAINFVKDYGAVEGEFFHEFMGKLIKEKTGNPDYTFDDLFNDKGITLVIVTTDLSRKVPIFFYPNCKDKKYRNMSIRKAVRMSMSIPFLFEPITFDNDLYVDGGVLDNYPLHVFDGEYPGELNARLNLCEPNPKVLGIRIVTNSESYIFPQKQEINCVMHYALSFVEALLANNEMKVMTPTYWYRTVTVVTPDYPLTRFSLNKEEKTQLYDIGTTAMTDYFKETIDT